MSLQKKEFGNRTQRVGGVIFAVAGALLVLSAEQVARGNRNPLAL